uniref:Uncharacterized protein n=1 Tax=Lepeophtheirus salmonis TaxID=72036 RepID=A0A0K2THJ4_LEPSM
MNVITWHFSQIEPELTFSRIKK